MPVPTYDRFIEPILRYLYTHADGASAREVHDAAAAALGLTDDEMAEVLPSGVQRVYKNRAGWAHDRLKRASYSESPRRGYRRLTEAGRAFAEANPSPLTDELVQKVATEHDDVLLKCGPKPISAEAAVVAPTLTASPDDRLEAAVAELRATTSAELLEVLGQVSPKYFETIVLDVLHRIGYGTSRSDLQRVGGSGDGGIDGVISLDRLGLEKVYVQAKRWQNSVGRPDVQGFYGALAGQRAAKGVFITTSTFTPQALEFAKSVEKVVLVDGAKLTELMIDYEVGVTLRPIRVPKLDTGYFDE
ncbi:MAG: restriction endonuclease [Myxococcales bacterium]|nr:restriction endonuclease [Myxococcales bacterium]